MPRRPLVATVVTTVIGALFGALLGAVVGRVIAFFGDETIQTSVPMMFCGTLGFFVGGASAAKGSLDRFGAKRSGLGAFVALVVLIAIGVGAIVSGQAGPVIALAGVIAAVVAGAAATLVAGPQSAPVPRGGLPPRVTPPKEAAAPRQEQVEAEFVATPKPTPTPVAARPAIRKVPVVEADAAPEPERPARPLVLDEPNWTLPEEPAATPPARPRRDRPLRRDDAPAAAKQTAARKAPAKKKAPVAKTAKTAKPKITPPPAPRSRKGNQ